MQALDAFPDLRDNTLRGLAMSEADLEAMRDELAAAYDRYRTTMRPTTTTRGLDHETDHYYSRVRGKWIGV